MNVSDQIRVSDLHGVIANSELDSTSKLALIDLVSRIDLFITSLISQLKAEPTIYTVDPEANPEAVEGAKAGDVAIYLNDDDVVTLAVWPDDS